LTVVLVVPRPVERREADAVVGDFEYDVLFAGDERDRQVLGAGVPDRVRGCLLGDTEQRQLGLVTEAALLAVDPDVDVDRLAEAPRKTPERGRDAKVEQDARSQLEGVFVQVVGTLHQRLLGDRDRLPRDGIAGPTGQHVEAEDRGTQGVSRTVVQIAGDAVTFVLLDADRVPAEVLDLAAKSQGLLAGGGVVGRNVQRDELTERFEVVLVEPAAVLPLGRVDHRGTAARQSHRVADKRIGRVAAIGQRPRIEVAPSADEQRVPLPRNPCGKSISANSTDHGGEPGREPDGLFHDQAAIQPRDHQRAPATTEDPGDDPTKAGLRGPPVGLRVEDAEGTGTGSLGVRAGEGAHRTTPAVSADLVEHTCASVASNLADLTDAVMARCSVRRSRRLGTMRGRSRRWAGRPSHSVPLKRF
jgi:hypothetical protein